MRDRQGVKAIARTLTMCKCSERTYSEREIEDGSGKGGNVTREI